MARIQIELPHTFLYSTRIQIYQSHINEAGHLDNAQLLTLVSEARKRFFSSLGMQEIRVENMIGIVVADAAVQYASEAFHGETLVFDLACTDFNKYGCDIVYRIREESSGRAVANVKNGIVFFDYAARKIHPVPEVFLARTSGS